MVESKAHSYQKDFKNFRFERERPKQPIHVENSESGDEDENLIEELGSEEEVEEEEHTDDESATDDDDDDFVASDSDFESPVPVRTKTPKAKTPKRVAAPAFEVDDEIVEIFPSPSQTDKVVTGPFAPGQKFSEAEVGALKTKLATVRKSIESVFFFTSVHTTTS